MNVGEHDGMEEEFRLLSVFLPSPNQMSERMTKKDDRSRGETMLKHKHRSQTHKQKKPKQGNKQ